MDVRKPTDIEIDQVDVYFLPVEMRMPLKFGAESVSSVTCIRVAVTVRDAKGRQAKGWGETPLSITWAWPSASLSYAERFESMQRFCQRLAAAWANQRTVGHPLEIGHAFQKTTMRSLIDQHCATAEEPAIPLLAALIATSAFDIATHDAFGVLHEIDIYDTYNSEFLSDDLSSYLQPADDEIDFRGKFPNDFLVESAPSTLPVWHLVGGLDPLTDADLTGNEPDDGYPVTLCQWIEADGLNCLKVKLRGTDQPWDIQRLIDIGEISDRYQVEYLSADFNCTVTDPQYVNEILDRLQQDHRDVFDRILYVEQPFPYDLHANQIDVHSVARRKPLFLDESAHDWEHVALGRRLGWTGVALKTCKTQTGALLSACWAKAHGMPLMVQDLTNPMLAQIPHVRLAAHVGTIMGVESNGMQFYPAASAPEEAVHPGIYRRRHGRLDLSSLRGPGFGYRINEIDRVLPPPTTFRR